VDALGLDAHPAHEGRVEAELASGRAERAIEERRAELVEKAPVHRAVLGHSHGAGVAAGQDGLGILRGKGLQPRRNFIERRVPGGCLELRLGLGPDPAHRVTRAIRRGRTSWRAASLRARSSTAIAGCSNEYVPAEPQHRRASRTEVSSYPARTSSVSTRPRRSWP